MTQYLFFLSRLVPVLYQGLYPCINSAVLLYDNRLVVSFFQYLLSVGKFSRGKEKGTAV